MAANGLFLLAGAGNLLLPAAAALAVFLAPRLGNAALGPNVGAVYELLILLLPLLLYWRRRPETFGAMRLNPARGKHLAIAAGAGFVGLFLSSHLGTLWSILLQALGLRLTDNALSVGAGPMGLVAALLSYAVLPAVCEELTFRGAILGAYERNGTARAVAVSSALFALLHASVEGFPVQLLLGLVMAYFAVNADSVLPAMVYHFVHNAGIVLITAALPTASVDPDVSVYYAIGGMAGVLQSLLMLAVLGVVYAVLLLMLSSDRETVGIPFGVAKPQRVKGDWREQLVLLSGLVTAGLMMLDSLLVALRVIE